MSLSSVRPGSEFKGPPWQKSCASCRRSHASLDWSKLPVVDSLPPDRVQPHLSVPAAWTVELRRCPCGAVLAARR